MSDLRRLRALFVIPGEAQGSSMVFARRQAEALERHGIAVETFYLRSRTSLWALGKEAQRFSRMRRNIQPDLVHAHFGTVTALFSVLLSSRVPVIVTYRGSDLNRVPTSNGLRAWCGRLFSQFAALGAHSIVCVSRKLRDRLWWCRHKVIVLPSGVDPAVFSPMNRDEARRQLQWSEEDLVVLFNAGHDARNKRLDLAEAAFALVQAQLPQARLLVLAGSVDPASIPLLMNAADCLLVTSDAEGSPTVVQEALATNLPVVSVDVGDVAERLTGVTETHIVARDASAIATALTEVLSRRNRSNGRLRIRDVDSAHIADELAQLYLETVAAFSRGRISAWNTTLSSQQ